MSVFKRTNSDIYVYDFVKDGKRYCATTGKTRLREAEDVERQVRNALEAGTYVVSSRAKLTFRDFVETRVLPNVRLRHADKPRTIQFYESTYTRINGNSKFASLPLRQIAESEAHINDYAIAAKAERRRKVVGNKVVEVPIENATVNRRLAAIRKALHLARKEKLIPSVPHIEMLEGERERKYVIVGNERDVFLNGGTWRNLKTHEWQTLTPLVDPLHDFADFLFETCLRVTEGTTLVWSNVFLDDAMMPYIRILRDLTKGKKERHVPLSSRAVAILQRQRDISRSNYVFVKVANERVRKDEWYVAPLSRHTVSEQFSARRDQMGLPWDAVLHSTRHSGLTELGASGAGAFTIRDVAGHQDVRTSQRYVHPMQEELKRAFERKAEYQESIRVAKPSLAKAATSTVQ